jgi:thiosulfate/3-mercaptopyruvate sulfurtransferase
MSPQEIAGAAGKLGIETSKTIVVYTDPTGWGEDGRDMWTLQSIGVTNVKMLDGGYPAWVAAGKEVSRQTPTVAPTTVSVGADKLGDVNVTTEQVKQAVATSGTAVILDARAKKEYDGATDFGEARGGHIKGAVNLPYPTLFNEDGTVKSDADLESMFKAAGVTKDKPVYVYCTKGIRSAYLTELLWMLGYDKARNYDASYYSWAGDSSLPVEK